MYVSIYIYITIHTHIYTHTYVYLCIYVYMFVCINSLHGRERVKRAPKRTTYRFNHNHKPSQTVYNTKGTRAHTHRELIRKWLWEPKGSSLEYI